MKECDRVRPPKPPSRPPTIRDVAARAGVSPATVSNALSGSRGVTGDRRRAVLEAVAALGYKSNHMASSLRRGETRTVGIVVPNLGNEFYAGLVRQWERIASQSGYEMLVVASGEDPVTEARRIESLIARRIDGLLVVAAQDEFGSTPGFPGGPSADRPGRPRLRPSALRYGRVGEFRRRLSRLPAPPRAWPPRHHAADLLDQPHPPQGPARRISARARRGRACRARARRLRRRHGRRLPQRHRAGSPPVRSPDRDFRRDVLRDGRRGEGDQRAGAGFSRGDIAARLRALRVDDGRAALYQRGRAVGRRAGEPILGDASPAHQRRGRRSSPACSSTTASISANRRARRDRSRGAGRSPFRAFPSFSVAPAPAAIRDGAGLRCGATRPPGIRGLAAFSVKRDL